MVKTVIGQVRPDERDEILALYERRNGLTELAKIITADNAEMYEKVVSDLGITATRFHQWWERMAEQYAWQRDDNGHWEISFDTGDIFLVTPE